MRVLIVCVAVAVMTLLSGCGTFLSALGFGAGAGIPLLGQALKRHEERGKVQDFAITLFNGKEAHVSDYAGQPLVINFWADW